VDKLRILFKKYTFEILEKLYLKGDLRFKELKQACKIEKMLARRLDELVELKLVKRRLVNKGKIKVYRITKKGCKVFELLNEIKKILV